MGLGEFGLKKNDFVGVGMQLGDGMGNYPTFRNLEYQLWDIERCLDRFSGSTVLWGKPEQQEILEVWEEF